MAFIEPLKKELMTLLRKLWREFVSASVVCHIMYSNSKKCSKQISSEADFEYVEYQRWSAF